MKNENNLKHYHINMRSYRCMHTNNYERYADDDDCRRGDETNCLVSTQSKYSISGGFPRIAYDCHYNNELIKNKIMYIIILFYDNIIIIIM